MAHLLLIDDEAPIRASLREILEYEGHKVAEAGTGMDGILAATKTSFDAIFCDVKMPQMDGLDVLDMLAKKQVASPVIMISGHGTVETAVDALKKGAYDFIQKPLDLNRVLVTLRNVLEREVLVETTKVLAKKVHTSQSHQWSASPKAFSRSSTWSTPWRQPTRGCSSRAPTGLEKNSWRARCTTIHSARTARLWK